MKISRFAIIIGAMKSGTTSLFSLLSQHPEVCACRIKEPEFFIKKIDLENDLEHYYSLWDFKPERHKIAVEASTSYTKLQTHGNASEQIARSDLNVRFIYIMRHPIKRIESQIRMSLALGYKLYNERNQFIPLFNSQYYTQIVEYYKRFPRENILLLNFEIFVDDPLKSLKQVCTFLDIEPDFQFDLSKMDRLDGSRYQQNKATDINIFLPKNERDIMLEVLRNECELLEKNFGFDTERWHIA
jgi:hypothetical protein